MTNYLRCCAGCSASIVIHYETPHGAEDRVYCSKCRKDNDKSWSDFDPQPYPARDNTVRRWSSERMSVFDANREWCVLAREGDTLTVRPLGRPDMEPVQIHISDARPRSDRRF